MVSRMVLVCVGIVALQVSACAQGMGANVTVGQLKQALEENNSAMKAEFKAIITEALAQKDKPQKDEGLVPVKPVGTIEERVTRLEKEIGNHGTALGQIAMQGESGDYHLRFDTNSQSARNEFKRALKNVAPPKGEFVIRNKTPWLQRLVVNGYEQQIAPYDTVTVSVDPGTVMSWLPGEQRLTWHIGMPNYRQVVELHQRQPEYVAPWVGY